MLQSDYFKSKLLSHLIVGIHVLVWLMFFHIVFDLRGLYYSLTDILFNDGYAYFDEAFILMPLILILFYWNSQCLIPKYVSPKNWLRYIVYLVLSYLLCVGISIGIFWIVEQQRWELQIDFHEFEDVSYSLFLVVILASLGRGITKIALNNAHQVKELKQKHKEAELNYLQAQINPHFIFNTLNTIYALSDEEGAMLTTEAILKFSELMRYPIHEGHQSSVMLEDELNFINHFIELQKLKLGSDYPICFEKEENLGKVEVIPLCLIPIVENAFKYGVSHRFKSEIIFKVYKSDGYICFETENQIIASDHIESHQIGIENLKQRLNLFYNGKSKLITNASSRKFNIKLMIPTVK